MQANWGLPGEGDNRGPAPVEVAYGEEGGVMGGTGRREDPAIAIIYTNHRLNQQQSEIEGHPVFDDTPFIKIMCPGDVQNIVNREVTDRDKRRFPVVWKAYTENKTGVVQGIPLEEMPLTRKQVLTLKALGVMTVEMLADLGDDKISMTITRDLRKRAQEFLGGAAEVDRELRKENQELRQKVESLGARVHQLMQAYEAMAARANAETSEQAERQPMRPRRGRPPKNGADARA